MAVDWMRQTWLAAKLSCALGALGCSTRLAIDAEPASCDALMNAPAVLNECLAAECDWVWVSASDGLPRDAIFNPADVRLNGVVGVAVSINDERWRRFDELVIRVERATPSSLSGLALNCAGTTPVPQPFHASPLAPKLAASFGFQLVTHVKSEELGAQNPYRGSDLALVGESTLVLALGTGGISVVDAERVADGALHPIAHIPAVPDEDFNDVVSANERYLFVASKRRGLVIWDLLEPSTPGFVTDGFPQRSPKDGHNLLLRDDVLYLAQAPAIGTGALWAFDVSEPTNPIELWHFAPEAGHDVHDVSVVGRRFYVSSLRGGLYVLGVQNPHDRDQEPQVIARAEIEGAHSVAFLPSEGDVDRFVVSTERLNGQLFIGQFDPNDSAGPLRLAPTSGARLPALTGEVVDLAASPHNVECVQNLCFVAHYQLGLRVFDWSSPDAQSTEALATFATWQPSRVAEQGWLRGASGVLLTPSIVYALDTHDGLFALRYAAGLAEQ